MSVFIQQLANAQGIVANAKSVLLAAAAQVAATHESTASVKDILNDGNDFDVSEGDLDKIRDEFKDLTPAQREVLLSELTDHELEVLFHNVHSSGFWSNDWNKSERHEFYSLIADADDETLARIAEFSPLTLTHLQVYQAAGLEEQNYETTWSNTDIARWKLGDGEHLWNEKQRFIEGNRDIINALADQYNIPPLLLAGVGFNEFGGDPLWIDDVAGTIRGFDHSGPDWVDENLTITADPNKTSYGNMSIQVRTAAETLGYDPNNLSGAEKDLIIEALKDPVVSIAIAAQHISDLSEIDYPGIDAANLTDDQIRDIATRYNRGSSISLQEVQNNSQYGDAVLSNAGQINDALAGNFSGN